MRIFPAWYFSEFQNSCIIGINIAFLHKRTGKIIYLILSLRLIAFFDRRNTPVQKLHGHRITESDRLLKVSVLLKALLAIHKLILRFYAKIDHKLINICLRAFGINIKSLFAIYLCILPLTVIDKYSGALQKRLNSLSANLCGRRLNYNGGRCRRGSRFFDRLFLRRRQKLLCHPLCNRLGRIDSLISVKKLVAYSIGRTESAALLNSVFNSRFFVAVWHARIVVFMLRRRILNVSLLNIGQFLYQCVTAEASRIRA